MKSKLTYSAYLRTVFFSVVAAFTLLAFINADEVKAAFHAANGIRHSIARSHSSTPVWLQVPEAVAGVAGRVWYWLN